NRKPTVKKLDSNLEPISSPLLHRDIARDDREKRRQQSGEEIDVSFHYVSGRKLSRSAVSATGGRSPDRGKVERLLIVPDTCQLPVTSIFFKPFLRFVTKSTPSVTPLHSENKK